jgi:uncharacterized membrane protein
MTKLVEQRLVRYLTGAAGALGLAIMGYLTYIHYANVRSFCDISAEVSCDVVTTSIYSELFGVPVSVLGLLYFAAVLYVAARRYSTASRQALFFLTVFVLMPSLYLTVTEALAIGSYCILCESSKVLMLGILAATFPVARHMTPSLGRAVAPIVIAGLVASAVMYFAHTGVASRADYTPLVRHLNEQGWVYYKSYTCSNCKRQELLLGKAYGALANTVECHPEGPGGNPELCLRKKITKTPTWLLERDGREVQRLEGLQQIEELERASDYRGQP